MRRLGLLLLLASTGLGPRQAHAQAQLADDLIIISKGAAGQEHDRTTTLGPTPGKEGSRFEASPGARESLLERRAEPGAPRERGPSPRRGLLSAASGPVGTIVQERRQVVAPPRLPPSEIPLNVRLELPEAEDPGPADGLTLEAAIGRLLQSNHDLRIKAHEIPAAQADILSAGLRANPILFASADAVPYGSYSPRRPGANDYTVVVVQPFDVNGKRGARLQVAHRAKRVLEAQYQDAARLEIDNLATAYVDALEARESVRFIKASLKGLDEVLTTTRKLHDRGDQPLSEVERLEIQRDSTEIGIEDAEGTLARARQTLADLLDLPDDQAAALTLRGSLRVEVPPPPPVEALIRIADCNRPDLNAYRLGVGRAEAEVNLAKAERFEDVFVLFTPYTFTNYAPQGEHSATSWSLGGVVSVPLFNRNQGNIAKARTNVAQSRAELTALERRVASEVRRARNEYEVTGSAIARLESQVLPKSRRLRDETARLFGRGAEDTVAYLNAQRDYNEVVRQYRADLTRHRRAMLKLNTAVGMRILP